MELLIIIKYTALLLGGFALGTYFGGDKNKHLLVGGTILFLFGFLM